MEKKWTKNLESQSLRIFQHTPGTYQNDPEPTVYGSEFLEHLGVEGEAWNMRNRGIESEEERSFPLNPGWLIRNPYSGKMK